MLQMAGIDANAALLLVVLILILCYIAYLHIQISKTKMFLNSLVDAMHRIDKSWQRDDIFKFLRKLENTELSGLVAKDHIFDHDVMRYIFENESQMKLFLHYTREKHNADAIVKDGFRFTDSFHATAENIFSDKVDFVYKHNIRKHFGKYVIVLAISKNTFDHYTNLLRQIDRHDYMTEHVLAKKFSMQAFPNVGYLIPIQFVKGYIDIETGLIVSNKYFDPNYRSPLFDENIQIIKAGG
jgi:hypothetical protein